MEHIDLNSEINLLFDKIEKHNDPAEAWRMLSSNDYKELNRLDNDDLEDVLSYVLDWFITVDFENIKYIIDTPYKRRVLELFFECKNGKYYFDFKKLYVIYAANIDSVNLQNKITYGFDLSDFVAAIINSSSFSLSDWVDLNSVFTAMNEKNNTIFIDDYLDKVYGINGFDVSSWGGVLVNNTLNDVVGLYNNGDNFQELLWNTIGFVNGCLSFVDVGSVDVVELFDVWFSNVSTNSRYDRVLFNQYLDMCLSEEFPYSFCLCLVDGVILNN